jgi:hypothetical protein
MISSRRIRHSVKQVTEPLKLDDFFRQSYVEIMQIGEHVKFSLYGRPRASSTILIAGSGRSGTTWLSELLCSVENIQTIFEPLHPGFNPEVRKLTGWDERAPYFREIYLPSKVESPGWTILLEKVLRGRIRNYWTDYERNHLFPDNFLVKDIWTNMMLKYIYDHFQPRIIYMLRHPCAVVHSRLTVGWHATVNDILSQDELVNDYLSEWIKPIKKEDDLAGAHTVWWAVENMVALDQLKEIPHKIVLYEELMLEPAQVLGDLLVWLGSGTTPNGLIEKVNKDSRMSNKKITYKDGIDRLTRWQKSLPIADQRRVLGWASRMGLDVYDSDPFPQPASSS